MSGLLNKEDCSAIENKISEIEKTNQCDVKVAIVKESYNYMGYELLFGLGVTFLYTTLILFFRPGLEAFIRSLFWDYSSLHILGFYSISPFLIFFLFYFLANIPFIDRLIIPNSRKKEFVRKRAMLHFVESGVYANDRNLGILIFISQLERRVEIIADRGFADYVDQNYWDDLANSVIEGIKKEELKEVLLKNLDNLSGLLDKVAPLKQGESVKNQISDSIDYLES